MGVEGRGLHPPHTCVRVCVRRLSRRDHVCIHHGAAPHISHIATWNSTRKGGHSQSTPVKRPKNVLPRRGCARKRPMRRQPPTFAPPPHHTHAHRRTPPAQPPFASLADLPFFPLILPSCTAATHRGAHSHSCTIF